jgi:uncharacterized protein with HEPN domain
MNNRKRNSRVYLEDILAAIAKIGEYTKEGKDTFFSNEMMQDAVIRQISIIGEAAAHLPASLKTRYPGIPWKKTVGMRNIVIHDYSETDIPTVWVVAERDLPILKNIVENMLKAST